MKTIRLKLLLVALALVAVAVAQGCGHEPRERRTETVAPLSQAHLPVRDFVQLPRTCPGAMQDLDTFRTPTPGVTKGTLVGLFSGPGRFSIYVREPNGALGFVAPPAYYVQRPVALTLPAYRVACSMRATLVDKGVGPAGEVFSYDKSKGTEIVCWHNANGTSAWSEKVVAKAAPNEPKDAYWPLIFAGAHVNGVQLPDGYEAVYVRDAEYAPWIRTSIARAPREGTFFARVSIGTGAVTIFDQDGYPDWRQDVLHQMGPVECDGRCGWVSDGVTSAICGGCSLGQSCRRGSCQPGSCTPLTVAEACVDKPGAAACGERSDGCGGKIACPSCASGTCGANGDLGRCGSRPAPMTIEKLRQLYQDVDARLCGTMVDPDTGVNVVMPPNCANCVDNVCRDKPLPPCVPSDGGGGSGASGSGGSGAGSPGTGGYGAGPASGGGAFGGGG